MTKQLSLNFADEAADRLTFRPARPDQLLASEAELVAQFKKEFGDCGGHKHYLLITPLTIETMEDDEGVTRVTSERRLYAVVDEHHEWVHWPWLEARYAA
jgi:hypothetical protein